MKESVQIELIDKRIFIIRGHKVMLSMHLSKLYGVKTKVLIQAVNRNIKRFPPDFMFQLTWKEIESSRSQFVTLNDVKRGENIKYAPYAFTEQGVAMLSTVLNSERAIHVNISIVRAFVRLREILSTHKELAHKLNELERKTEKHDTEIKSIFEVIRQLMEPLPQKQRPKIGFHP